MAGECPNAIPPGDLRDRSYFIYVVTNDIDTCFEQLKNAGSEILK